MVIIKNAAISFLRTLFLDTVFTVMQETYLLSD
jgi:hypothetical protein